MIGRYPRNTPHHNNATHTSTHGRWSQGPVRTGTSNQLRRKDQWLTTLRQQVPQARLVACRWLVRTAQELARKHCYHARCRRRNHSYGVERQRRQRAQIQDARGMLAGIGIWCAVRNMKVHSTDTFRNSLTGSHLRDTGRSRLRSTRPHRSAKDPHRKQDMQQGSDVELWRLWNTA